MDPKVMILPGGGWLIAVATREPMSRVIAYRCDPVICWTVTVSEKGETSATPLSSIHDRSTPQPPHFQSPDELIETWGSAEDVEEIVLGYVHPDETSWKERLQREAELAFERVMENATKP